MAASGGRCGRERSAYRWVTPHGLARVVTRRGTAKVKLIRGPDGDITGEIYDGPRIDYHPRK